jgi:hypothetical protein
MKKAKKEEVGRNLTMDLGKEDTEEIMEFWHPVYRTESRQERGVDVGDVQMRNVFGMVREY